MDKNWKSFWKTLFQNLYVGTMLWASRSSRLSFMELLYEGLMKLFIILKSLSNRLINVDMEDEDGHCDCLDETKIGQHSS